MDPSQSVLILDLFFHSDVVCFFLRRGARIVPLGAPRDFFLVEGWGCREGTAVVGATMAL